MAGVYGPPCHRCLTPMVAMEEWLIYREEVTAVIGALADIIGYLRDIRDELRDDGEEE
jgi:hypothetical protein